MPDTPILNAVCAYILANEGGYSNDPDDHGGPTNFGITWEDLSAWRGKDVNADDVRNMSQAEAFDIYWAYYLEPMQIDKLTSPAVACCLGDTGILYGTELAVKYAQRVANTLENNLNTDGIIGPLTVTVLNTVDVHSFIAGYVQALLTRINTICASDPSQEVFRAGWSARANKLLTLAQ